MFKNYLKIAWRNLIKDKTFTFINVIGLSVAFGVAILLFMAGFFELSYNSFHKNGDRIYEVYSVQQSPKGPQAGTTMPSPFAKSLQNEVPGIEKITRVLDVSTMALYKDKEINLDAVWVDPDFFSMFTFPIINGISNGLQDISSVVITENASKKIFGNSNSVGKTFNLLISGIEKPFTVSAVVGNNPTNSTLDFEIAIRFENNPEYASTIDEWDSQYHSVYAQLQNDVSVAQFEQNTQEFVNLHYKEAIENLKRDGAVANANGKYRELKLLPLKDVRFTSFRKGYAAISRSTPIIILGIAGLILFIACVNFINMSIAKSAQRLKEIGIRKTLGVKKKQLFFQFWGESLFIFLIAITIGIILSVLLLDNFKSIFRTAVTLDIVTSPLVIIAFIAIILLITLIVGGYPAILLSRIGTIQSLKGKLDTSGKNRVRDVLMIVQFGIAILLITATLILRSQIEYMRNKDLGFNKEQVVSIPLNGKKNSYSALQLLKQELNGNPDILGVSGSDNNLGRGKDGSQSFSMMGFDYKGRTVSTNFLVVDYEYIPTLDVEMVMGRNFNSPADSLGVIINEAMAKELGEEDPLTAQLEINDGVYYPVLGVVKDYHFQELDRAINPLTYYMSKDWDLTYAYVKVASSNMANSFDAIEDAWHKIEPNAEFLGSFLDENIDRTFQREKSMATLITSGSVIAIVLSCIGLFAMSMLIVSQRTKEIGIRKVVGASVFSVTYILTKDFLKLVLVAFIIASPIAWWVMNEWLQNYAFRIDLSVWFFIISGFLALIIALATIGTRTIKAARQNPVKSLRTE